MKTTIVPRDIDGFNAYVNDSTNYLMGTLGSEDMPGAAAPSPMPYVRLGLSDTEMNQWRTYRDQWAALYPKYSLKEELRTTAIKNKLRAVLKNFVAFSTPRLRRMSGSENANEDDEAALGFKITRHKPTHRVTPIESIPFFGMAPIGGGDVKFTVRGFHDADRASKLPGANIEVRYRILQVDDEEFPKSADELPNQYISTKAIFVQHCGANLIEKVLYAAMRWVDLSNPARNGPWTNVQHCPIA